MKKHGLIILILLAVASCNNSKISEEDIIGKWNLIDMKTHTDLNPLIELEGKRAFINNYQLIFLDSNDFIYYQTAIDTSSGWGVWKLNGNMITIYNLDNSILKVYEIKKVKKDKLILKHNIFKDEYTIEEYERMEFEVE